MAQARDNATGDGGARELLTMASDAEGSESGQGGDGGGDGDGGRTRAWSPPRGTALHRYVLHDEIGAGAMGVVYAAYDYGLDRRVALKLVLDPGRTAARTRLLREAQALAQLSHPNVVTVFDVPDRPGRTMKGGA